MIKLILASRINSPFMLKRNIILGYILSALNSSLFWFAPWLLFLYKFVNIEQVALLQAIGLATRVIAEIPTGALADLLGKKRTLTLAFFLTACGETTMAFSHTMPFFMVAYIVISLGYSFYSGTMDAFLYDTLFSKGREKDYPVILSRSSGITNFATAIAAIVGSLLFSLWIGLPFLITGVAKFVGFFITFFVDEPKVDTFKFSFRNFVTQTRVGFHGLFSPKMVRYTCLILIYGMFSVVAYELLDDAAVVDWGYTAVQIGVLYSVLVFISIPMGFLYAKIVRKTGPVRLLIGATIVLALNYLFSPWINVYVWTTLFFVRVLYSPLKNSAIADIINTRTTSNVRVTTLSTVELLNKLPFVFLGMFVGLSMKAHGIKIFSSFYAVSVLIVLGIYLVINAPKLSKMTEVAVE